MKIDPKIEYNEIPNEYKKIVSYTFGHGRPKVYMQAAIHSNETIGSVVLQKLTQELKRMKNIEGTIKIIPFANPLSLGKKHLGQYIGRHDMQTMKNWNRGFPGNKRGDIVERLCFTLHDMFHDADYIFDLHNMNVWKSVIYSINSKLDDLTKNQGLDYIEVSNSPPKDSLRYSCKDNGTRCTTYELGSSFFVVPEDYRMVKTSILSALNQIGSIKHKTIKSKQWFRREDKRSLFSRNKAVVFLPTPPKTVKKGELIYKELVGDKERDIYSHDTNVILRSKLVHFTPAREVLIDMIKKKKIKQIK